MRASWVQPLGQEDALEKGMATHSSILAWRIPWTEEPGGLQAMDSQSWTWLRDFRFSLSPFYNTETLKNVFLSLKSTPETLNNFLLNSFLLTLPTECHMKRAPDVKIWSWSTAFVGRSHVKITFQPPSLVLQNQ